MLNLYKELKTLTNKLSEHKIEYALCGGLAMAIYGFPRATVDIDMLILSENEEKILEIVNKLDYTIKAIPMNFADSAIQICRISKIDADSNILLPLDLLLVTPKIKKVWETRQEFEWENDKLWVVSIDGLITLKMLRNSGQDQDDIKRLRQEQE